MTQGLGWEAYAYPLAKTRLLAGNTPAMALEPQPVDWQHPPLLASGARLLNKTAPPTASAPMRCSSPSVGSAW
nr:hypothetical protein [Pseudomonas benzopyrenica]